MERRLEPVALAETAAAISDAVHNDRVAYRVLYDNVCDEWSGFPGIWVFIAQCAVAYQEWFEKQKDRVATDERFIDDCEAIAIAILKLTSYPQEVKNMLEEEGGYNEDAFMIGVHDFVINVIHARNPITLPH